MSYLKKIYVVSKKKYRDKIILLFSDNSQNKKKYPDDGGSIFVC